MGSPRRRRHAVVLQTAWVGVAGRSRCTTNCNRSPACHLPGRRVGGPFAVFPGPLRNGVELPCGVDEARSGRAAEGWRVRYRRPADRRVKSDHGGKTGRPFASRPVILPTYSVAGQVRPAVTLELRGRRSALVWVGRHDHPPASSGRPSASRSLPRTRQHALHAEPCPPSRRRR